MAAPRSAAELPGAVAAALPATLSPQLATAAEAAPTRGEWLYELKLDGYRLLTRIDGSGRATLHTRNGHDWTVRLLPLAAALEAWNPGPAWLDGEVVVQREDGTPQRGRRACQVEPTAGADPAACHQCPVWCHFLGLVAHEGPYSAGVAKHSLAAVPAWD